MEYLYCTTCKDYTKHLKSSCIECKTKYDKNAKRYIIAGPEDDEKVIKSKNKILKENPDAIIIPEEIALKHKLRFLPSEPSQKLKLDKSFIPKNIGRNDLCPCGSGKKYKKCCL